MEDAYRISLLRTQSEFIETMVHRFTGADWVPLRSPRADAPSCILEKEPIT